MRVQAATLYVLDGRGRLTAVNAPGDGAVPRLFVGRTAEGYVLHARQDLPDQLVDELAAIAAAAPPPVDLEGDPGCLPALRAALARHGPVEREGRGPAYLLPSASPPSLDGLVELTEASVAGLSGGELGWIKAELAGWAPACAVVEGDTIVALCMTSRLGSRAAEAGLEVLPSHRRRGLATAVTAAWAQVVQKQGRLALYSTGWSNLASRGVARRLGGHRYGEDVSLF